LIDAIFGSDDNGEKATRILESLFYMVVTRFEYCLSRDINHFSGYYALELLIMLMKRISSESILDHLRWPLSQLLFKFNFYFDGLIDKAYKILGQRETSMHISDKAVILTLKSQRLLLIDYFCTVVVVSVGQRRSVPDMLNSRVIDIIVTWIKEKFDNAFVMVCYVSCSRDLSNVSRKHWRDASKIF
jgi:hypothetical protein